MNVVSGTGAEPSSVNAASGAGAESSSVNDAAPGTRAKPGSNTRKIQKLLLIESEYKPKRLIRFDKMMF